MAQRYSNFPIFSDCQGEQTNPVAGTVMADTGPISMNANGGFTPSGGGVYEVLVTGSATASSEMNVQRRNAANTATVGDALIFYLAAGGTVSIPFRFELENGERVRVTMNANLAAGDAVANIQAQRVG